MNTNSSQPEMGITSKGSTVSSRSSIVIIPTKPDEVISKVVGNIKWRVKEKGWVLVSTSRPAAISEVHPANFSFLNLLSGKDHRNHGEGAPRHAWRSYLSLSVSRSAVTNSLRLHGLWPLQAPLSMGFPRKEYWSGLSFPSPENLPDPGIELRSPALQADSLSSEP